MAALDRAHPVPEPILPAVPVRRYQWLARMLAAARTKLAGR